MTFDASTHLILGEVITARTIMYQIKFICEDKKTKYNRKAKKTGKYRKTENLLLQLYNIFDGHVINLFFMPAI